MFRHLLIKKLAAIFLLFVFTLGLTPKKTLHNLLADHADNTTKSKDGKVQQISKAGFNCKCDDFVAESTFIAGTGITINTPVVYNSGLTSYYISLLSLSQLLFNLRGPPVKF